MKDLTPAILEDLLETIRKDAEHLQWKLETVRTADEHLHIETLILLRKTEDHE